MLQLRCPSSPAWLETVLADFDAFLADHAACERKASASALAFVVKYPDRTALHDPLIALAQEELEHFRRVAALMRERKVIAPPDTRDPYVRALLGHLRVGREARLLDRLLSFAVIEARGCERFGLVGEHHADARLRDFYGELTTSEARHHGLFLRLAREYFAAGEIEARLDELLAIEATVLQSLTLRAALH